MKVNIIHDSRRTERFEPLIAELFRQKINDYEIWPCIILPNVVQSISESHKMIVRKAKEDGLMECCIGEDDLYFPSSKGWEWFMKNIPRTYDIYTAANYLPFEKTNKFGAIKVKEIVGLHLYIIHSEYYDVFLSIPENQHIDTAQKSDSMYCCYPFAALQRPGFSINNMAHVNYNSILQKEDIYTSE